MSSGEGPLPSGEHGRLRDPSQLPRPALWPPPPPGQPPVPITGKDDGDRAVERTAARRLPLAYTGVGLMIAGVIALGFAVALGSWLPVVLGVVLGTVGLGLAVRSRVMNAATVGTSVTDSSSD